MLGQGAREVTAGAGATVTRRPAATLRGYSMARNLWYKPQVADPDRDPVEVPTALLRVTYGGLIVLALCAAALSGGCGADNRAGVARGKELFETCVPCHGKNGGGSLALRVPAIAGLPDWYLEASLEKYMKDIRGAHPDDLDGHRMRPMARTLYRPGDVQSVAGYVSSMPKPGVEDEPGAGGDPVAGRAHYEGVCVACHGPAGEGNKDMGSPPLTGQADWYLVAQILKFKHGMRGAHPEDITGAQMAAMAAVLPDTAAVRDVAAYIRTLPR